MTGLIKKTLAALAIGAIALSSSTVLAGQNSKAKSELKNLLQIHIWTGRRITPAVREAAGDITMAVFDNRVERYSEARCSFITYRGKRALTCDSI